MSAPAGNRPPSQFVPSEAESHEPGGITGLLRLNTIDRFQQRRPRIGFLAAVIKKFGDDQGTQLAALISYYGFVSLFPLLLVLVTVLGFVLQGDHAERERILSGTLGQFPVVSDQISRQGLRGSPAALAIGLAGSVLAGMGIMGATQTAMNRIWHVPFKQRPNWLFWRLRAVGMLSMLALVSIVSTVAAGFVGSSSHSAPSVAAGIAVAFAANLLLFMVAFKVLTAIDLHWRTLLPGVVVAAVSWQVLQHLGGYYVDHELKHKGALYGTFALVLGLLAWLYLGGQLMILAAEVNVVKARRLYPRSFLGAPLLDADRRSLRGSAESEERVRQENVDVDFDEARR